MAKLRFRHVFPPLIATATLYSCASPAVKDAPQGGIAVANPKASGAPAKMAAKKSAPTASKGPTDTTAAAKGTNYGFREPKIVKGIYLTAWSAGSKTKMAKMLALIERTELNAVVIDVRDTGDMYWKTGIPLADQSGATMIAVAKPAELFQSLAKHHVWPIARIACFRDNWVPKHHPELAVQLRGGGVWHDRSHHSWLDPYNRKNWEYLAQTVDFAMNVGFPEIQLDYVRFPSEGKSATQFFLARASYENGHARPEDVIATFARYIGKRVHARGAVFSSDIFGIISSNKGSEGIGQQLEKVAGPFDVISPMVYPSHFAKGEYGIADPNRSPYEILIKSLGDYKKRLPNKHVRPWLQDFSLGYHYGPTEVKEEFRAARQIGYPDFLLWNAGNHYTEAALARRTQPLAMDAEADKPAAQNSTDKAGP